MKKELKGNSLTVFINNNKIEDFSSSPALREMEAEKFYKLVYEYVNWALETSKNFKNRRLDFTFWFKGNWSKEARKTCKNWYCNIRGYRNNNDVDSWYHLGRGVDGKLQMTPDIFKKKYIGNGDEVIILNEES